MNLFILSTSPYGQNTALEGLNAILAFAAFAQPVSVLFTGYGVLQLLSQQQTTDEKNISKVIKAFDIYEVENTFVNKRDFETNNLQNCELCVKPEQLDDNQCRALIESATRVFRF